MVVQVEQEVVACMVVAVELVVLEKYESPVITCYTGTPLKDPTGTELPVTAQAYPITVERWYRFSMVL